MLKQTSNFRYFRYIFELSKFAKQYKNSFVMRNHYAVRTFSLIIYI